MPREIVLVRHGETVANVARIWQGHTDSELSPRGREQAKRLAARLTAFEIDVVVSSDLGRAAETAAVLGRSVEHDLRWREMHLGTWEGLTRSEVEERYADELAALRAGDDLPIGGGERLADLEARAAEALLELADRLDDGERALVVSHGGPIISAVQGTLGVAGRGPVGRVNNTSITRIRFDERGAHVAGYNDTAHLDGDHDEGLVDATSVVVIRHGETVANVQGRWQGSSDAPLSPDGMRQLELLPGSVPPLDVLFTSPLQRAAATAAVVARHTGLEPSIVEEFAEIAFGAWEGLTSDEIAESFPDEWKAFSELGEDRPRGGSGESFAAAGARMAAALIRVVGQHPGSTIGAVSHGGVVRAWLTDVLGIGFAGRHRLGLLDNTAMARVVFTASGPALAEYNVAPHLGF